MKKVNKIAIAKCILGILGIAGIVTIAALTPNSLQMLNLFGVGKKQYKSRSIYKTLKRMETQRFIDIKEKDDQVIITITNKGRKRLLKYNIDDMQIKKPKKWDKKWRLVSFDVPEKQKKAREALRNKLKDLEFFPLQKSLFVSPFPCKNEVDFISEIFQIQKYIIFTETSKINNEYKIKEYFDLV